MVKRGIRPRGRIVALLAGRGEAPLHMVGIRRPLEVFQVAGCAGRGCPHKISTHMALDAGNTHVRSRKRKTREAAVVEGGRRPTGCVMADRAILREACLNVIRIGGAVEVFEVAASATCAQPVEVAAAMAG